MELNSRVRAVIEYAKKKGVLVYSPQSLETDDAGLAKRKGYSAEDVTGFWSPGVKDYFCGNYYNFIKAWEEFGFLSAFKFLSLSSPWSGWTWVIDSSRAIAHEIIDSKIKKMSKKEQELARLNYASLINKVTKEEIFESIKSDFEKINDAIWVSKHDASVIIYDEEFKRYLYPDGWSKEQIGEILSEWLEVVAQVKLPVKYAKEASW